VNEFIEHCLSRIRNDLQPILALSLNCPDSDSLVTFVTPAVAAHLPASIGFIDFNYTAQKLAVNLTHSRSDTMAEIPRRFISNIKRALHLQRGHAFLRFGHQVDRQKPLRQRKVSMV